MAYLARSLVLEASVPYASDTPALNWYKYATTDAVATVIAAGYFNNARDKLRVGDVIDAVCAIGGATDRIAMLVATVPVSGNVTVAINTDASGA